MCALDFLVAGPVAPAFQVGADGNIVAELAFMEYLHRQDAMGNHAAVACLIAHNPILACLDIGAATTLDGQMQMATTYGVSVINPSTHLFGGSESCGNQTVGDGKVGLFDIAILLWWRFQQAPYHTLSRTPSAVATVSPRTGYDARCAAAYSTYTWSALTASNYCFAHAAPTSARRRRLADAAAAPLRRPLPPRDVTPEVFKWSNLSSGAGNWYRIRLPGTQMALELMLDGVFASTSVELNNERYPPYLCNDCLPISHQPDRYTLLFARRFEYTNPEFSAAQAGCALILAGFGSHDAVIGQTLGIRQQPALQACPFGAPPPARQLPPVTMLRNQCRCVADLFLFVPHHSARPHESTICPSGFGVLAGSSSMDAIRSLFIRETVCALEYPFRGNFNPVSLHFF